MTKGKLKIRKVAELHTAVLAADRFAEKALGKMFTHHWWCKKIVKIVPNMNPSYMTVLIEGQLDSNLKDAHKIQVDVLMWVNGYGINMVKSAIVSVDRKFTKFWAKGEGTGNDLRRIDEDRMLPAEYARVA